MRDPVEALLACGFNRVVVLDGEECALDAAQSLVLALWFYKAEAVPAADGAWIHPYYFASQKAYVAASSLVKSGEFPGLALRDEIRVKPIFARLPDFSQGTNTISYVQGVGSRFHVQILTCTPRLPATAHLLPENKPLHCGSCRRCVEACPTNALDGGIFHRERCLRNWMMVGGEVPEEIRAKMGNRLIGCDVCQRVCPHNPPPQGEAHPTVPLSALLQQPKEAAMALRPLIGVNLTLPNRVLSQSCLLAGCSGDMSLLPLLQGLRNHPSPAVQRHAAWAAERLEENEHE